MSQSIEVRVLFFSSLAARVGRREVTLELDRGSTVQSAFETLCAHYPDIAKAGRTLAFAVNHVYVNPGLTLQNHDELAIIQPVSGG